MRSCSVLWGHPIRLALVTLLTLISGSSASAQDRETFRCAAPNGHYDNEMLRIWDKTTVVTGRINVHKADRGTDWASSAKIAFTNSKDPDNGCHCNGVYVEAVPDKPYVDFFVLVDGEATVLTRRYFETPTTFRIAIDANDRMTVQIGKDHPYLKTVSLHRPARDALLMTCSGIDVSFLNVDPR